MLKDITLTLTKNQFNTMKGHIIGNLGFHRQWPVTKLNNYWQITHVPTGLAVIKCITSYKEARQVVLFLNKTHKWEFKSISAPLDVFSQSQIDLIKSLVKQFSPVFRLSTNSYTFDSV